MANDMINQYRWILKTFIVQWSRDSIIVEMKLWHNLSNSSVVMPGCTCGVTKSRVSAASLPALHLKILIIVNVNVACIKLIKVTLGSGAKWI